MRSRCGPAWKLGLREFRHFDFASALRDLEAYLRLMPRAEADSEREEFTHEAEEGEQRSSESAQIWEHVKTLRRRVAGFN